MKRLLSLFLSLSLLATPAFTLHADNPVSTVIPTLDGQVYVKRALVNVSASTTGGTLVAFAMGVNGVMVLPMNIHGWFEGARDEGLKVTTGSGSTTGIIVTYIETNQ